MESSFPDLVAIGAITIFLHLIGYHFGRRRTSGVFSQIEGGFFGVSHKGVNVKTPAGKAAGVLGAEGDQLISFPKAS
jgi:hypothetical protein